MHFQWTEEDYIQYFFFNLGALVLNPRKTQRNIKENNIPRHENRRRHLYHLSNLLYHKQLKPTFFFFLCFY